MADETGVKDPAGSSPASTATASTPAETAAPATSAPATTEKAAPPSESTPSGGAPPSERWPDILNNARTKARAEAESEFKQKYGKYDVFEQDPWGAVQSWLDQASKHSIYGPHVTAYAAKHLQAQRGKATGEEPAPDVPIVDAQGNVTGQTYSAARLKQWQDWNWQQREAALNERFQPLEQMRTAQEAAAQTAERERQAGDWAGKTLETLYQDPLIAQHKAAIEAEFIAHEEYGDNVHAAALKVLTGSVFPKALQGEQAKTLESLKTQAAGSTVHPGPAGQSPPKFKSGDWKAALKYYQEHPDEAEVMANKP